MFEVILSKNVNEAYASGFRVNGEKSATLSVMLRLFHGDDELHLTPLLPVEEKEGDYSARIPASVFDSIRAGTLLRYEVTAQSALGEFHATGVALVRNNRI